MLPRGSKTLQRIRDLPGVLWMYSLLSLQTDVRLFVFLDCRCGRCSKNRRHSEGCRSRSSLSLFSIRRCSPFDGLRANGIGLRANGIRLRANGIGLRANGLMYLTYSKTSPIILRQACPEQSRRTQDERHWAQGRRLFATLSML